MKSILMSMRVVEAQNYKEERNSIAYRYIEFFESLGFIIYLIPNNSINIEKYFDNKIDLVVLTGGNNVNPKLYDSESNLEDVYIKRDETEKVLVDLSLKNNIPLLGICRGFHFLNVYFAGTISHNIKNHVNIKHNIKSSIFRLDNQNTNSFHNQAIKVSDLAKNLEIIAKTEDNIVEAFINRKKRILAFQWHPERQNEMYDKEVIMRFIEGKL